MRKVAAVAMALVVMALPIVATAQNWLLGRSSAAQVVAAGGTIKVGGLSVAVVQPAGNINNAVIEKGTRINQAILIINKGDGSVNFNVQATSNVAGGATLQSSIAKNTSKLFLWDSASALWFPPGTD